MILLLVVIFGTSVMGGLAALRYIGQAKLDADRLTYELNFPNNLTHDQAELFVSSLSGVSRGPSIRDLPGHPTIVFELLGTPDKIQYFMTFARRSERAIQAFMVGSLPTIAYQEVSTHPQSWTYGIKLKVGRKDFDPDPRRVAALLLGFGKLHEGEALMGQFIISPVHHSVGPNETTFQVFGRLAGRAPHHLRARELLGDLTKAYGQLQVMTPDLMSRDEVRQINARATPLRNTGDWPLRVTSKALTVIMGLPIDNPEVPGLSTGVGRTIVPSNSIPEGPIRVGVSNHPNVKRPIGVAHDTMIHEWILGKSGRGKTVLMLNQATRIMELGYGMILLEPDGRLARSVLDCVPQSRIQDVIWFDPNDEAFPIGWNILQGEDPDQTAGNIVALFKNLYGESWGPRLEQILSNAVLTAATVGLTIYDVKQLLINESFRARVLKDIKDPDIKSFWKRLEDGPDNAIDSVLNKLDAVVRSKKLRHIVGQTGGLDIAEVVRQGKILIVPLDEDRLGAANASILGATLLSRAWSELKLRGSGVPFFMMLDEWQHYLDQGINLAPTFSEGRKYNLNMIVANQYIGQLGKSVYAAVDTNASTRVCFAVSDADAKAISPHFSPLTPTELAGFDLFEAAVNLMSADGKSLTTTVKTYKAPSPTGFGHQAKQHSRAVVGRPLHDVETELRDRHKTTEPRRKALG